MLSKRDSNMWTCDEKIILRKIFVSEKRLSDIDLKRLK